MKNALNRILLVDDEPDIRLVARRALEALGGYTIETCESGEEAIEKAESFDPELVLLDVMMPAKDGPATLAELRLLDRMQTVPVVFMTARVQKQEIEEYLSIGATDVISKPFDPMSLSEKIQTIWASCNSNEPRGNT